MGKTGKFEGGKGKKAGFWLKKVVVLSSLTYSSSIKVRKFRCTPVFFTV